jgi:hypothetical protein
MHRGQATDNLALPGRPFFVPASAAKLGLVGDPSFDCTSGKKRANKLLKSFSDSKREHRFIDTGRSTVHWRATIPSNTCATPRIDAKLAVNICRIYASHATDARRRERLVEGLPDLASA